MARQQCAERQFYWSSQVIIGKFSEESEELERTGVQEGEQGAERGHR